MFKELKDLAIFNARRCVKSAERVLDIVEDSGCDGMLKVSDKCIVEIRKFETMIRKASLERKKEVARVIDNDSLMNAVATHFAYCGFIVNPNDASHVLTIRWTV